MTPALPSIMPSKFFQLSIVALPVTRDKAIYLNSLFGPSLFVTVSANFLYSTSSCCESVAHPETVPYLAGRQERNLGECVALELVEGFFGPSKIKQRILPGH